MSEDGDREFRRRAIREHVEVKMASEDASVRDRVIIGYVMTEVFEFFDAVRALANPAPAPVFGFVSPDYNLAADATLETWTVPGRIHATESMNYDGVVATYRDGVRTSQGMFIHETPDPQNTRPEVIQTAWRTFHRLSNVIPAKAKQDEMAHMVGAVKLAFGRSTAVAIIKIVGKTGKLGEVSERLWPRVFEVARSFFTDPDALGRLQEMAGPNDPKFLRRSAMKATDANGRAPRHKHEINGHVLYQTGDDGIPPSVLDRNGEVVLDCCKLCGKGESQLDNGKRCEGPKL